MAGNPTAGTCARRQVLLGAGAVLLAGGCSSGDGRDGDGDRSPFTGERTRGAKVLAVKVDNVRAARPQAGLDAADIVYTEQVEAGLTRVLAVFASRLPPSVGPVRSARESDLELLRQFGRPAFAYSGVQSGLRPAVEGAPLEPLTPGRVPDAFERMRDRPAPHDLFARPDRLLRAAGAASAPRDIGFRFGPAPDGGRAVTERTVRFPAARPAFTWSARRKRWLVSLDGTPDVTADHHRLTAATVVVQQVRVRASRFGDRSGSNSPFTETVGSGRAVVLRDGRAFAGRWHRARASDGTAFTGSGGERLPFARGPVWVVLAPA